MTVHQPTAEQRHRECIDVHLILRRDGPRGPEVLLSRRAGDVYATGMWHLLSGHLDGPHEDVVEALVREAREESGIGVDPVDVGVATVVHHRAPGGSARVGFFFEVRRWQGTPAVQEPQVCDAMGWFALDNLPTPMVAYCRAGLDAYLADRPIAVHFQQPGDPIAYSPDHDRLRILLAAGDQEAPGPQVRQFAEQAVGRITTWIDTSWLRDGSRVWRAGGASGGTWFVKVHQNDRFHDREVTAYRTWVPTLGGAAPRLVAADLGLRAIVITAVPGRPLHGAVHSPAEQQLIFHAIGALAAAIHRYAPCIPAPATETLAALGKLERHLTAARGRLAPGDEDLVRTLAEKAAHLPPVGEVATHGDLQLRNLLWDGQAGRLFVIDFERSEPGPAVRDLARLADAWADRPDLHAAFLAGYDRPLTPAEEDHLAFLQALDSVSAVQYGSTHNDPELVERGLRTLARLRAAHRV